MPALIPSATYLPSATFTCTPVVFSTYHLIGASFVNSNLIFSISVPGISGQFWAMVNNIRYTCSIQPNTANTLYCSGAALPIGTNAAISVFRSDNSQQAVMVMTMAVPQNPQVVKAAVNIPLPASTAVTKIQPTNPPAATVPASSSGACTNYCAVNGSIGNVVQQKQCGFSTQDEAWKYADDLNNSCPSVPGPTPGVKVDLCGSIRVACITDPSLP
jgi:hypothetical protein